MTDFAYGFLARVAVMIPTLVIVAAGFWYGLSKLGVMRSAGPFNVRDLRTWPLSFALVEAALFGVIFAAVTAALGDSQYSAGVAGAVSALLTLGPVPVMLAKIRK